MALPSVLPVLAIAGVVGGGSLAATLYHDHGVPERAAVAYVTAARSAPCPLDYRILVGIGAVESGHGTHGGSHLDENGRATGSIVSSAGATGPMQFMEATWAQYATDGDGDGVEDPNDIDDAAAAAAKLLCASNVDENVEDAVGSYNGGANWQNYSESRSYVAQVDERVAALPADDGAAVGSPIALPDDEGRICGASEWLTAKNDCTAEAKAKAAYLWAQLGNMLGEGDTPKLHAMWAKLNGTPTAGVTTQPISATTGAGLKGDYPGLPNSAGLQEDFAKRLARMVSFAPGAVTITSGYRSTAEQADIIESHGGECGYMVACIENGVCGSYHCKGLAVDLAFEDGLTDQWFHANAARFGVKQALAWEGWHFEPVETRNGGYG